jgi:hypothetical protein
MSLRSCVFQFRLNPVWGGAQGDTGRCCRASHFHEHASPQPGRIEMQERQAKLYEAFSKLCCRSHFYRAIDYV